MMTATGSKGFADESAPARRAGFPSPGHHDVEIRRIEVQPEAFGAGSAWPPFNRRGDGGSLRRFKAATTDSADAAVVVDQQAIMRRVVRPGCAGVPAAIPRPPALVAPWRPNFFKHPRLLRWWQKSFQHLVGIVRGPTQSRGRNCRTVLVPAGPRSAPAPG